MDDVSTPESTLGLIVFDEEKITEGVFKDLESQREKVRSYFDLIPQQYREYVEDIARENFRFYSSSYGGDRTRFREDIAKNWLARFNAFGKLAEKAGLRPYDKARDGNNKILNRSAMAMLTSSASNILIGNRAYELAGPGAAGVYSKISLRIRGPKNQRVDKGVYLGLVPGVGERIVAPPIVPSHSSPLVSIYIKDVSSARAEETAKFLRKLDDSATATFRIINSQTLSGPPMLKT